MLCLLVFMVSTLLSPGMCVWSKEHHLVWKLMHNYERMNPYGTVRPVTDINSPIDVYISLEILDLDLVDLQSGIVHFRMLHYFSWRDDYLRWNPDDYDGLQTTYIHGKSPYVWRPDLVHSIHVGDTGGTDRTEDYIVSFNGTVIHPAPADLSMKCNRVRDDGSTTFTELQCVFVYFSWTYPKSLMDLHGMSSSFAIHLDHLELPEGVEIVENLGQKFVDHNPVFKDDFPAIEFFLGLKVKMEDKKY